MYFFFCPLRRGFKKFPRFIFFDSFIQIFQSLGELAQRLKDLDKRIEEDKPWELLKTSPQRAKEKIHSSLEELYELAVLLEPFIPSASLSIQSNLTTSRIETK